MEVVHRSHRSSGVLTTQSGSYTMGKADFAILANGNITLPSASTAKGMIVFIKNVSATSITVSTSGTDKIEGKSSEAPVQEIQESHSDF